MLSKSQRSGMKGISSLSLLPLIIGSLLLLQHNFLENNIKICLENSQKTQASSLDVHFQKRDEIFKMYNTCNLVEHWFPLLKIIFQNCILTTRFPTVKKKKKIPQITWIRPSPRPTEHCSRREHRGGRPGSVGKGCDTVVQYHTPRHLYKCRDAVGLFLPKRFNRSISHPGVSSSYLAWPKRLPLPPRQPSLLH